MLDAMPVAVSAFHPNIMLDRDEDHKVNPGTLYYRQPRCLEIIQLVEAPAPPPRRISSVADSSSAGPSSSSYASTSDDDSYPDEDEDEESECSSYCSSDLPPDHSAEGDDRRGVACDADTYSIRMRRVEAWRNMNDKAWRASCPEDTKLATSLKRKPDYDGADDDTLSQSSKRSRPQDRLTCSACDASFCSSKALRQHGAVADASEACRTAVEYGFE